MNYVFVIVLLFNYFLIHGMEEISPAEVERAEMEKIKQYLGRKMEKSGIAFKKTEYKYTLVNVARLFTHYDNELEQLRQKNSETIEQSVQCVENIMLQNNKNANRANRLNEDDVGWRDRCSSLTWQRNLLLIGVIFYLGYANRKYVISGFLNFDFLH